MKKLPQSIFIYLSPSKLFIKDLELIEQVYKDNCKSYTISTEEYELDSIEELKELNTKKYNLIEFSSKEPHISLVISSDSTRIYSHINDVNSIGIVAKLKHILKSYRSPFFYSFSTWSWIIQGCTVILVFLSLQNLFLISEIIKSIILALEFTLLLIQIFILKFGTAKFPVVYINNKNDGVNFWLEHKNLFITGIIAFIVQLLILWMKETVFK